MPAAQKWPRLHIAKQAHDVAAFTVSSAPPSKILVATYAGVLGLVVAVAARYWQVARINSKQSITWFSSLENTRHAVFLVLLLLSACAWLTAMSTQTEDTLLAIRYLGIQLSHRKYIAVGSLFKIPVSSSTVFIPLESVKDILMLEGIRGWSVVFYLAIVQEIGGSMQIHVAFPHLMPRLHILRAVYSGARAVVNGSQQTTAADTPV